MANNNFEKKGMFEGCTDVIKFTAQQNAKGRGFKKSTFIVGFVIVAIFALISVLMAVIQKDNSDDKNDTSSKIDVETLSQISKIMLVDNEELKAHILGSVVSQSLTLEGLVENKLTVELVKQEEIGEKLNSDGSAIAVMLKKNDDGLYTFDTYIKPEGNIDEDIADKYMGYVVMVIETSLYQLAGISAEDIMCMEASHYTQALKTGEDAESFGVMFASMIVPMIFSFAMYAMVMMYGQSITKSVVSEKSSKLMEYLLTSIKPYALISGKIIAISGTAILQMAIWICCGVGGYIAGTYIAEGINPDYINYVDLVVEYMGNEVGEAFSMGAIVLAIATLLIGFIMYCILAALIASAITKIDDMSSSQGLFQIPVMFGWMAAYFAPMVGNDIFSAVVNYIPFTSPFVLPANILLGNCTIIDGILSLGILFITMFVLTIVTGRVYKGKVFNRK